MSRPIDMKREEYRKYLEKTGVLEAMTRGLVKLYEEEQKPSEAVSFLYNFLAESFPDKVESAKKLEAELKKEKEKNKKLTAELEAVKAKLAAFEKAEADAKDEDSLLADPPGEATPIQSSNVTEISVENQLQEEPAVSTTVSAPDVPGPSTETVSSHEPMQTEAIPMQVETVPTESNQAEAAPAQPVQSEATPAQPTPSTTNSV